MLAPVPNAEKIAAGGAAYRRMNLALFLGGFATFSLLYCVQPLLPAFTRSFGVGADESSLAVSVATGGLAIAIILAGALSQSIGRRGLMFASMLLAAGFNLIAAAASDWGLFLAARTLEGLALGGVPAVAMAYIAEEVEPRDLPAAMGLYIAGTAFGGMMGRVGMGLVLEVMDWRAAMGVMGLAGLVCAVAFVVLLPRSRHFARQDGWALRPHVGAWMRHLRQPVLIRLFAVAFLLMGVFITLFNYIGFRLEGAPWRLSEGEASLLFLVYGLGMVASSAAGRLTRRFDRSNLLFAGLGLMIGGVFLTLTSSLWLIGVGLAIATIGFFAAHAVASGWVGDAAEGAKGHAASLYLLFYYAGPGVIGLVGGAAWLHFDWPGVAGLAVVLLVLAAAVASIARPARIAVLA